MDPNWLADYPIRDVSVLYSMNFHDPIECLEIHMLLLLIVKVTFKTTTFKQTFKIYQNKFVAVLISLELFFVQNLPNVFPLLRRCVKA